MAVADSKIREAMGAAALQPEHAVAAIRFCRGVSCEAIEEMTRAGGLPNVLAQFNAAKAEVSQLERTVERHYQLARQMGVRLPGVAS